MDSLYCAFEKRKLPSKDDTESCKSIPLFTSTIKTSSLIQFGTRISSSASKSNKEKLAQTDVDIKDVGSPKPSKRSRTNSELQIPVCQVHGCNKDLSCSKDYHKRHKVCDIHSKTSVVVVSGIQQRFCQQCSRFHIVEEFDGGKRSCRKRLAGHNERRRKPLMLTRFGSNLARRDFSLLFPKTSPAGGLFGQQCYEPTQVVPQSSVPMQFGFFIHLNGIVKQCPFDNRLMKAPLFIENLYQSSNYGSAHSLLSSFKDRTYRPIHRLIF